ncbi:hypothetical protein [Cardinium endosymbiont of Nabis limbatus]|uniref:hypothetical protein n=1 Tax=Cardinium endosymbiont of Nabis limbatus TaxID=3066217 RepID=UPI003AF39734
MPHKPNDQKHLNGTQQLPQQKKVKTAQRVTYNNTVRAMSYNENFVSVISEELNDTQQVNQGNKGERKKPFKIRIKSFFKRSKGIRK